MQTVKLRSNIYVLALAILFTGCSQIEIDSEYDKQADFSSYKSFSVCMQDIETDSQAQPQYDNLENRLAIRKAIENEMKNLYSVNDASPDLRVGFHIQLENKKIEYRSCTNEGMFQTWRECRFETMDYTLGTLIIYIAAVKTNQIIWQASATGVVENGTNFNEDNIDKVVKLIFKKFPSHQYVNK